MDIFKKRNNSEKEIRIKDGIKESSDKGVIIEDRTGQRGKGKSELEKEAIALDALVYGQNESARIHNVSQSRASKLSNLEGINDEESRAKILNVKHGIQDIAISKLMDTLNLFEPSELTKQNDIVNAASKLSQVVDKITGDNRKSDSGVHLHFYSPRQKKLEDYKVIDV